MGSSSVAMVAALAAAVTAAVLLAAFAVLALRRQRKLGTRAYLMQEAVRNGDFSFRLPERGLRHGERAMQRALNSFGSEIGRQRVVSEVESWQKLTRVLTHEIMNAVTPISSISQAYLDDPAIKGSPYEEGLLAIRRTGQSLENFVRSYRKLTQLQQPVPENVALAEFVATVSPLFPSLEWHVGVPADAVVRTDANLLRQVLVNLAKNAAEAGATAVCLRWTAASDQSGGYGHDGRRTPQGGTGGMLEVSNDGAAMPPEVRRDVFVPFYTTKRGGSGVGLSLSRQIMVIQGGNLTLADRPAAGYSTTFLVTFAGGTQ